MADCFISTVRSPKTERSQIYLYIIKYLKTLYVTQFVLLRNSINNYQFKLIYQM